LVRKPQGKRALERPRHRWVDTIKADLVVDRIEIEWGEVH
jgi:hypothetical protein